jgi:putative inorganic carbon (hco3(-)) transporter
MPTTITRRPISEVVPSTRRSKVIFILCVVAIFALSIESAIEAAIGGNKLLLIVPLGGFAGIGMVALGLVNFENFVLTTIAIRASLDITKPQSGNSGAAGVGNPTAAGLDPAGALAVLFLLVAFFWFLTRMRAGRKSPPASIHRVALIIFTLTGFLSIIDSALPSVSLLEAIRVAAVAMMLAVLEVMLVDRESVKRLSAAIYVSSLVPVGYTIFNVLLHHPQFTSGGFARYEGTFSQPNPFAIYLTMLIVMGAAIFPHLSQKRKIGMSVLLALSIVCLYYTFTRSAWIACLIGLFAVAVIGRRRLMLGLMVGGIMVALVALPSVLGRFADLGSSTSAAGYSSNSLEWRFSYWGDVLPLADKDPITGIGLNMSSYSTDQAKEPHNDFLRAYVETGVIGTIAYLILLVSMVMVARDSLRFTKRRAWTYERSIAVGFASCVIAFVIISIVSNVITEVIVLWYYVAFAAAAYAVTRYSENAVLAGLPPPVVEPEPIKVGAR